MEQLQAVRLEGAAVSRWLGRPEEVLLVSPNVTGEELAFARVEAGGDDLRLSLQAL